MLIIAMQKCNFLPLFLFAAELNGNDGETSVETLNIWMWQWNDKMYTKQHVTNVLVTYFQS